MTTAHAPTPRSPLQPDDVAGAFARRDLGGRVHLLEICDSTNARAAAIAREAARPGGAPSFDPTWFIVAAEEQTHGRGRLDRQWSAPKGSGLLFTVALAQPAGTPPSLTGWLPLVAGLAVAATARRAGVPATLKWPNDVVIGSEPRKLAGVLVERVADWALVGVGLNVDLSAAEAPVSTATSLVAEGASPGLDRAELLADAVAGIVHRWRRLQAVGDADRSGLREEYRTDCSTLGHEVLVHRLGAVDLAGRAVDIDADGHLLLLDSPSGARVRVTVGDVVHVRPASGASPDQA